MGLGAKDHLKGAARAALFALSGAALAGPAPAQDNAFPLGRSVTPGSGAVQSPVLTLDQERMFADSDFGKRVAAQVAAAQGRLQAENRKIEAQLAAEEKKLTEERKTMAPDAFSKLADAFDAKVQKIRHDQDAKNRIIDAWREGERKRFYEAALPVLGQLVRDAGAVAILNNQAVFLSFKAIDATDRAIERLNATIGDGAKDAPKIDLSAPVPPAGASGDPVAVQPRAVVVPGAGEAIAPNGAIPPIKPKPRPDSAPAAGSGETSGSNGAGQGG